MLATPINGIQGQGAAVSRCHRVVTWPEYAFGVLHRVLAGDLDRSEFGIYW